MNNFHLPRSLLTFLAFGLATSALHARLGDTERDCVVRYGSATAKAMGVILADPLVPEARQAVYEHEGWRIRVAFIGDQVVAEEYRKSFQHPNGAKIIDAEIAAILKAEMGSASWSKPHLDSSKGLSETIANALLSPFTARIWDRSDGAKATLLPPSYMLVLETPVALKAKNDAAAAKAFARQHNVPKF